MVEPENLVLEQLRAIRVEMAKLADWTQTMSTEMTAMQHHLLGVITTQNHDHGCPVPADYWDGEA